ncbi:MAG: hypothetical protein AB7F22_23485 [Reyranella sp.]|uniref:hypothetical protein n=1 Tax=Reyranella sp. TaxID=1929291 RepID=UPI003D10F886
MPSPPTNMLRAELAIGGLASPPNALLAWHPRLSLDLPLLVVLFFHGREPDPQNFAWTTHRLPDQVRTTEKNAVVIAPTMQKTAGNDIVTGYLNTHDGITGLLRQGLNAVRRQLGEADDDAWANQAIASARLLLAPYSNGYLAWTAAMKTLRSTRPTTSTEVAPPAVIGHSAFDCLYWDTPVMDGVDRSRPTENARFSEKGRALLDTAFVTTHFTKGNETLTKQARYLATMVVHDASLRRHDGIPDRLGPTDIAGTVAPIANHDIAVSHDSALSRVVDAVEGFDLPAVPPA